MSVRYFRCKGCSSILQLLKEKGGCCFSGESQLEEIIPGITDAATEKHLPVPEIKEGKVAVKVGSKSHPMSEEHSIEWVSLETKEGVQTKFLSCGQHPAAEFSLTPSDKPVALYAYCNLHGLWKTQLL